jgi:hypothetical protein
MLLLLLSLVKMHLLTKKNNMEIVLLFAISIYASMCYALKSCFMSESIIKMYLAFRA